MIAKQNPQEGYRDHDECLTATDQEKGIFWACNFNQEYFIQNGSLRIL